MVGIAAPTESLKSLLGSFEALFSSMRKDVVMPLFALEPVLREPFQGSVLLMQGILFLEDPAGQRNSVFRRSQRGREVTEKNVFACQKQPLVNMRGGLPRPCRRAHLHLGSGEGSDQLTQLSAQHEIQAFFSSVFFTGTA